MTPPRPTPAPTVSSSACARAAEELRRALGQCVAPKGCTIEVTWPDARTDHLDYNEAVGMINELDRIARAEEEVRGLERRLELHRRGIRDLGFDRRADAFAEPAARAEEARQQMWQTIRQEACERAFDKAVELLAPMSPLPGPGFRALEPGQAAQSFGWALTLGKVALDAWAAATTAGLAVYEVERLSRFTEQDLEALRTLSRLQETDVAKLKTARAELSQLPPCDARRIARVRVLEPEPEKAPKAAKKRLPPGTAAIVGVAAAAGGIALANAAAKAGDGDGSGGSCSNRSCIRRTMSPGCSCNGASRYGQPCGPPCSQAGLTCAEGETCINGRCYGEPNVCTGY